MRYFLTCILFTVLIITAGQSATVYGFSCEQAELTNHSFTGKDSSYIVTRRCTLMYDDNCKQIYDLTYYGTWKGETEVASEHVTNRARYYDDGEKINDNTYHQYIVTSKCLQDPWLTGMDCYSHHVQYPYPESGGIVHTPPNPKGASVLPPSIRQSLQQEYYAQREAPTILSPSNSDHFGFPTDIPIRIQHNPAYGLRFKIEWRPDAQHALQQVASVISGKQTSNGIMTATLHPIKEGEWTFRAQLDTNNAPWWSDPVTINVRESILGTPLGSSAKLFQIISPRPQQTINTNLALEILVNAGIATNPAIELEWSYHPKTEPGQWPAPPEEMDVIPQVTQYRTIIPFSSFHKMGYWRVFAYVKNPNTGGVMVDPDTSQSLSDTRDFIIGASHTFSAIGMKKNELKLINKSGLKPAGQSLIMPLSILSPAENQKFNKNQPVVISLRSNNPKEIIWQVEKKAFNSKRFSPQKKNLIRLSNGTTNQSVSKAVLKTAEPGHYRFRFRNDMPKAQWSSWRIVKIGLPAKQMKPKPPLKSVEKTTLIHKKTPLTNDSNEMEKPLKSPQKENKPAVQRQKSTEFKLPIQVQ